MKNPGPTVHATADGDSAPVFEGAGGATTCVVGTSRPLPGTAAAVMASFFEKWLSEKCDWHSSPAMQEDASAGEDETSSAEFRTMELDGEEGTEFDVAGERVDTKSERKRDRRDDRADQPHSPLVRLHRYHYDGAGDARRGCPGSTADFTHY